MKMKLITDDGQIQGSYVSLFLTLARITTFILSYFMPSVKEAEKEIGAGFTTFALTSVASWFTYKIVKPLTEKTP
jgi:hypothetical protein